MITTKTNAETSKRVVAQMATQTVTQMESLPDAYELFAGMRDSCRQRVQGRDDVIDLAIIALLSDGHILLEDHPGSGKTTLAKALGECIVRKKSDSQMASFRRIQFTPDLLPSDVTGTTIFDPDSNTFQYRPGPVFANLVLADEINRTSPKVQASLLEAMGEKQVTVDNTTHELEELFFVMATQNPLDLMGTYPLPRAQLDRFLFKIHMTFLERESELDVLSRWGNAQKAPKLFAAVPKAFVLARKVIGENINVSKTIHECLVDIANELRNHPKVAQGVSTRCLVNSIAALQTLAMTQGREFVTPDDIRAISKPLFSHRLELIPGVKDVDSIVEECVKPVLDAAARKSLK